MTPGQTRVLVLLLILLAMEAVKQPAVKAVLVNLIQGVSGNAAAAAQKQPTTPLNVNFKLMVYWTVGALALVALAGPAPDMATMLAIILIFLVLLSDIKLYTGYLTPPVAKK